jgi:hypothetical protein
VNLSDMAETITGFSSTEVIRTLIGSIIQGDRAGSQRWTAELLCSEKGYPKLLSIYVFIGFRYFLPASYSWVPHIRQKIRLLEDRWRSSGATTRTFRNSIEVRSIVAEWTEIWCQQQQKPAPKLPTKKEIFSAAAQLKTNLKTNPTPTLHPSVQAVWKAHYDSDDLRILANELIWAIQYHQMTRALLYFTWLWELDEERGKGGSVKLLRRGPEHIPESNREHIGWFIFSIFQHYAGYLGTKKNAVLETLELWKETWLLLGKTQRRQCLGAICAWLTEGTFPDSPLIKNPNQIRQIVGESEAIYGIIKNEMDGHLEEKDQKEKEKAAAKETDRFSMTKEQKEKESLAKMDIVNKKLAAVMGIDFTDFED